MRINFILPEVAFSGGIKVAIEYACFLKEKGHDVCCYYPLSGSYTGWKKYIFPVKAIYLWLTSKDRRGCWIEGDLEIKHPYRISNATVRDADVCVAAAWMGCMWMMDLSPRKGKKVYFIQGFEAFGKPHTIKGAVSSYEESVDAIIYVSNATREQVHAVASVKSKEYIVNNSINENEIRKIPRIKREKGCICIGFPYRREKNKNCQLLIELLTAISSEKEIKIMSYGLIKPRDWNEEWEFEENPSRSDLISFYERVDVFVVPSYHEGWGLPAMEAMAQGCAVISSNTGMIKEIGIDKINCRTVNDTHNKTEFKSVLLEVLDSYEEIWRIGENARKDIIRLFSGNKMKEKFERILVECSMEK